MSEHKAGLVRVVECPEVPLHNNGTETIIRGYVKTRKISGGTRSEAGRRSRDTFASLKKTCRILGVSFWGYLCDRVGGLGKVTRLAQMIRQKAQELQAGRERAASPRAVGGDAGGDAGDRSSQQATEDALVAAGSPCAPQSAPT